MGPALPLTVLGVTAVAGGLAVFAAHIPGLREWTGAGAGDYAGFAAGPCCHLHAVSSCCDPEDCGPCCEACPTCPELARQQAAAAEGGAR